MRVTVDRVGRLVIPKSLRMALGIGPGAELELMPDGAGLRLEPVRHADRPIGEADGWPILGHVSGAQFSDKDVRKLRDELNR